MAYLIYFAVMFGIVGGGIWLCYKIATWKPREPKPTPVKVQQPVAQVQQPVGLMRRWTKDRKKLEKQLLSEWNDKFARAQLKR